MQPINKRFFYLPILLITAACASPQSIHLIATDAPPIAIPSEVPLFPEAIEQDPIGDAKFYTVGNTKILNVVDFYEDHMTANGWEVLAKIDTSTSTTGESRSLMFIKEQVIVQIDVFSKDKLTFVVISAHSL